MAKYNILLAADDNYLPFAFVTCQSVINSIDIANNSAHDKDTIVFTIVTDQTVETESLREKCNRFASRNCKVVNIQFNIKHADSSMFSGGYQLNNSYAAYYRIIIDKLFDESVSEVLYLDCDILVRKDIRALFFCTDMKNKVIAGVPDTAIDYLYRGKTSVEFYAKSNKYTNIVLDLNNYINSGVLLFNLPEYRKHNISQKCLSLLDTHNFGFHDQDLLNVSIQDKVILDLTWNFTTAYYFNSYNNDTDNFSTPPRRLGFFLPTSANYYCSKDQFIEILKDPAIVHFTVLKPWLPVRTHFTNLPMNNEFAARYKEWYSTASTVVEFSDRLSSLCYSDLFLHDLTSNLLNYKITQNQINIDKLITKRKRDRKRIVALISVFFALQILLFLIILFK